MPEVAASTVAGACRWKIFSLISAIFSVAEWVASAGLKVPAGGRPRQHVNKGHDLRITVKVTLKDIMNGVDKKLKIPRLVACPHCKSTGAKDGTAFHTCQRCQDRLYHACAANHVRAMQSESVCPECNGEGKVISEQCSYCQGSGVEKKEEIVSFHIPAGVEDGMTLTMRGGVMPRVMAE